MADENESKLSMVCRIFYDYFLRYFLHQEVGYLFAIVNCLVATFFIGFFTLYLMKPWGFKAWNRNLIKNKKRMREIAFRRLREEIGQDEDQQKLEKRQRITQLSFMKLKDSLQKGELSAEDAVDAYRWKALMVNDKLNCVTEFIKDSVEQARELDEKFRNKPKPPLFGVPFSVKENFHMKGYECTCGLAKNIEDRMTDTCTLVEHLQTLGAIPIVRTNVPQTLLSFVCTNLIYGTTLNPHDIKRSPGGSSGGEGCLIAAGGCPFGTGSDLAGSLRIPAHFCGITTLKPSAGRLRVNNVHVGVPGVAKMGLSYGFFTRDVETLTYLFSLTLTQDYFDISPLTAPIPFRRFVANDKKQQLRIGYYVDDGWLEAVPSCKRAVRQAVSSLERQGHHVTEFSVPDPSKAIGYVLKATFPDNAEFWSRSVDYEDIDPLLKATAVTLTLPRWIRYFASKFAYKWPQLQVASGSYVKNLDDLRETYGNIDDYVKRFVDLWTNLKLDALVCPVFPFPAIGHEFPAKLGVAAFATGLFNLLDFPAGVVPVTTVSEEDDRAARMEYPSAPVNGRPGGENFSLWDHPVYYTIKQAVANSKGLPVGVQVVTLPFQEEKCLHVMSLLQH